MSMDQENTVIFGFLCLFFFKEKLVGSNSLPLSSNCVVSFLCTFVLQNILYCVFSLGPRCNRLTSGNLLKADV